MGAALRDKSTFRKIIPPKSLCLRRWSPEPSPQMTCGLKRFRVRKSARAAPAAHSHPASVQSLVRLVPPPVLSPPAASLHFTLPQVTSPHVGYSPASNSRQSNFASSFVFGALCLEQGSGRCQREGRDSGREHPQEERPLKNCDGMKRKSQPIDTAPCRHLPSLFRLSIFLNFHLSRFPSLPMPVFADVYLLRCPMPQAHFHTIASIRSKKARPLRAGQRDNPTD
ncbi:hypothetical protein GGP75_002159 [Salinibacter ruber]|nr:hypothetical protein [Salinibacter ruber]